MAECNMGARQRRWSLLASLSLVGGARGLRVAVGPGVSASQQAALVAAAQEYLGAAVEAVPAALDHARSAFFEAALDEADLDGIVALLDEYGDGTPVLCLGDGGGAGDVVERARGAADAFRERYDLAAPAMTHATGFTPETCVVAVNAALDGAWAEADGDRWFDASRVAAVDGLVDDALRADLLRMIRASPAGVDRRSWRRGALRDVVGGGDGDGGDALSGAGWGLGASRLAKLCDRDAPPEALVELQTRLDAWLRPLNAPGLVVSLLPEAALGDGVAPVAANAPVHGDRYDYHVDADPALLPPGPFADYHSRYPNRAPGRPRFVSALCYLAPDWPPEFGAPTRFLDPPTRETLDVAPEPGRVVFLDQDISHTVVAPAAAARDRPRYSLVLKLVLHPGDAESTARFAPDPPTTIVGSARRA